MGDEFVGQAHAAFIVEIQELRFADDGLRLRVVILAEEGIDRAEPLLEFGEQRPRRKASSAGRDKGREAIDAAKILLRREFGGTAREC